MSKRIVRLQWTDTCKGNGKWGTDHLDELGLIGNRQVPWEMRT